MDALSTNTPLSTNTFCVFVGGWVYLWIGGVFVVALSANTPLSTNTPFCVFVGEWVYLWIRGVFVDALSANTPTHKHTLLSCTHKQQYP